MMAGDPRWKEEPEITLPFEGGKFGIKMRNGIAFDAK